MSIELRRKSLSNLLRLAAGDTGKWMFLAAEDNVVGVLYLSLADGKIDKKHRQGRTVLAEGPFEVLEKESVRLKIKTGKLDVSKAKAGIASSVKIEFGALSKGKDTDEDKPKPKKQDEEQEFSEPVGGGKKKKKEEAPEAPEAPSKAKEEEDEEEDPEEEGEGGKKESTEKQKEEAKQREELKAAQKAALKDAFLQKLRSPQRIPGKISRLKAMAKKSQIMHFQVHSKVRDLRPLFLLDLKSVVVGTGQKLRRGSPKDSKVVKGQAWIQEDILYLRPLSGAWSPFLKTVRQMTKGRVKAVRLAAEPPAKLPLTDPPVPWEEAAEDVTGPELALVQSAEMALGNYELEAEPSGPLTEEEQRILDQAEHAEQAEQAENVAALEELRRRHATLVVEIGPYFSQFPSSASDKEVRRLVFKAAEKDPTLPELMRQGLKKMVALDEDLKAAGLSKKAREDEFWAFIPPPLRTGKYGTPNQRAFYRTQKVRAELMEELDKAGNPMEIISDIAGAVTIATSAVSIKGGIEGIQKDGWVGKWDNGRGLLAKGSRELTDGSGTPILDAQGNPVKVWDANSAFTGWDGVLGTTSATVEGSAGLYANGDELLEVSRELRRQGSPGKKMMAERKHKKTRRAVVTGALELGAGVASHFVPGLGVIGSAAALYRDGTNLHEFRKKVNQDKIVLQSAQSRGDDENEALQKSLEQDLDRMENRRNLAGINTTLSAVALGGDIAVASVLGAPVGAIVKASANGAKALARFTYRGIDSYRAVQAKRAEENALRDGSSEEDQLKAFEKHPHYAKIQLALAAKDGDPDAVAFFRSRGLSAEDIADPEITVKDLSDFALEEAEESANPGTMLDDVKAIGRKAKEVWDSVTASQAEKFAKKLEASLAEMAQVGGEVNQASLLYRDALLTDQSQKLTAPSKATKAALKRLEAGRKAMLRWTEGEARFLVEWNAKLPALERAAQEAPPPDGSAQQAIDAHQQRVTDAQAVPKALVALQGMVTQLTNLYAESEPAKLSPAANNLTENERAALQLRAPWPIADDPVFLESKAAVQSRSQLQMVELGRVTAEVESLEEELRDYVARGVEPTEDMKKRVSTAKKNLAKLIAEADDMLGKIPEARRKLAQLTEDQADEKKRQEMTGILEGLTKLAESTKVDATGLVPRAERVGKLADAKQGFISSLFFSPTNAQLWLKAGKTAVDLENSFREVKKLATEARYSAEDIDETRKAGEEPEELLKTLKGLHATSKNLIEKIQDLDTEAQGRLVNLAEAMVTATPEDRADMEGAKVNIEKALTRKSNAIDQLTMIRVLYKDLSQDTKAEKAQVKRPEGIFRNSKALQAFEKRLSDATSREASIRTSIQGVAGALADSDELKAGMRILRVHEKSVLNTQAQISIAMVKLVKANERIAKAHTEYFSTPTFPTIQGWKQEAAHFGTSLQAAKGVIDPLPPALTNALNARRNDINSLPELCVVPTLEAFGGRLEKLAAFENETGQVMPPMPVFSKTGGFFSSGPDQRERDAVAQILAPLRQPMEDRIKVVQSHIVQIGLDLKTLADRKLRLQKGLDMEDVEEAVATLLRLKSTLQLLETALKAYQKSWNKLNKTATGS